MMNERGYSLLEVMISMVVLAVAFLALIATQFGALNGYVSARDALQAAELGRRTSEILKIQGSQWISNVDHDGNPATTITFLPAEVYDSSSSAPTPFDEPDPIGAIRVGGGTWVPLVDTPVDVRFNRRNTLISDDHLGGKFCIYAKGAEMTSTFQDELTNEDIVAAMRFQIVVVYPGPRQTMLTCALGDNYDIAELDEPGSPGVPPPLETLGYRAAYFGTLIVRRAHLTQYQGGA